MNDYLNVVRNNYANFTGRARRREYWMFALVNGIITLLLYLPALFMGFDPASTSTGEMSAPVNPLAYIFIGLYGLYALAMLVPSLAVTARRLHDTGRSGWWQLINLIPLGGLVLLFFLVSDSQPGANKWGPNPKGEGAAVTAGNNW